MVLLNRELERIERHYFEKLIDCLNRKVDDIKKQLQLINEIKEDWLDIAFRKKTNIVDKSAERIIRQELLRGLNWDYLGIPISSDECFNLPDAVVHVDVKTQLGTERFDVENPDNINIDKSFKFKNLIASQNQITLPAIDKIPFRKGVGGFIKWEPHLPTYYTFSKKKKPCLTYFIRLVYTLVCPHCGLIQDIGPMPQKEIKKHFRIKEENKYFCLPYGKMEYSKKNSCKKKYTFPTYRLDEIVVYCVPNGQLIKEFYNTNWFQINMPYKSPIIKDGKIVGISSARIILSSFTRPTKVPSWWTENWSRTHKIKLEPIIIIEGE